MIRSKEEIISIEFFQKRKKTLSSLAETKMAKRSYPLDIEFKYLSDEKQLYIKQPRAYMD